MLTTRVYMQSAERFIGRFRHLDRATFCIRHTQWLHRQQERCAAGTAVLHCAAKTITSHSILAELVDRFNVLPFLHVVVVALQQLRI